MAEPLVGTLRRIAAGHPQRPRDVRAVAADRAADVEHDRLAGPDHAVRRLVVGRRRIRARTRRSRIRPRRGPRRSVARGPRARRPPRSARPAGRAAIWATTRSAAWAASVSRAISSASLMIRSSPRIGEASSKVASVEPFLEPAAGAAPGGRPRRRCESGSRWPTVERARTISATSAWASLPSSQVTTGRTPAAAGGQARAGVASRRGATSAESPSVGMTSIVSRSSGDRRVAGEIAHVGADPDQDRREARLGRRARARRSSGRGSARPGSMVGT